MKIRVGFVSNSSSSSFVMEDIETTGRLAKKIIKHIFLITELNEYTKEIFHNLLFARQVMNDNEDVPLKIPFGNISTLIWKRDNKIYIDSISDFKLWDILENAELISYEDISDIRYNMPKKFKNIITQELTKPYVID